MGFSSVFLCPEELIMVYTERISVTPVIYTNNY